MARPSGLVTGASRGIGLAMAKYLAESGYDLVITARDEARLAAAATELRALGAQVNVVAADMSVSTDIDRLLDEVIGCCGSLRVVALIAGVGSAGAIENYPMRRYDKQFSVIMRAPFLILRRCLPLLRAGAKENPRHGAKIIALSSIAATYPEHGLSAYGAAKAALTALCQSVNIEESKNGVSACAIAPAYVDTDMAAWVHDRISPDEMISAADIVALASAVLNLSANAVVPQLIVQRAGDDLYRA